MLIVNLRSLAFYLLLYFLSLKKLTKIIYHNLSPVNIWDKNVLILSYVNSDFHFTFIFNRSILSYLDCELNVDGIQCPEINFFIFLLPTLNRKEFLCFELRQVSHINQKPFNYYHKSLIASPWPINR